MSEAGELTPTEYIGHHLTNRTISLGDSPFWTLHLDTFLTALALAARSIIAGDIDIALSGGMESISLTVTKDAPRYANQSVLANEPHAYMPMIETAEIVAERYGISRARQDEYGAMSQQRAEAGLASGAFAEEIAPITVEKAIFDKEGNRTGSERVTVTQDEGIRAGTTAEALAGLKTVWKDGQVVKEGRHITAGNASQLSDGASACVLMEASLARRRGLKPLGIYRGMAVAGCAPEEMGIGPVFAVPKLLRQHGLKLADIQGVIAGLAPLPVTVHVSARQVLAPGFVTMLGETVAGGGLAPALVQVGLDEATFADPRVRSSELARRLAELGVAADSVPA